MNTSYKEFMGFTTPVITEADKIFDEILGRIVFNLIEQFKLDGEFSNIGQVLDAIEATSPEYSFLKEWYINDGKSYVDSMDFELPNTDDILDFLDYQSYLLETEESEQTIRNLVLSITAFCKETKRFLSSHPIVKLKKYGFFNQNVRIGIPIVEDITSDDDRISDEDRTWKPKAKSPDKTGLLVYI
ncbi:hypothetical protein [Lysinibacillus sphaericus]|uniref:hypothetical protein n=1 Tax=Lysinibacillus sphaericus TaxID=1421 RepID=UPI003D7F7EB3